MGKKLRLFGFILVALSAIITAAKAVVQFISCIGKMKTVTA